MQRLLYQAVDYRRHAQGSNHAILLRHLHLAHRRWHVIAHQQRLFDLQRVRLEPVLQFAHRPSINAWCAFILRDSLIRAKRIATLQHAASYPLPVCQASALLSASSRFTVTRNTLPFS